MFVDSTVLMGYNPIDPEADMQAWEVPGVNVTGAWKYSLGQAEIVVAVVDDGIKNYSDPEFRRALFINAGELPLPNVNGTPCADYDCNGDGRFDVDDYHDDDRLGAPGSHSASDLIQTFSNGVDEDGNGLIDDISGWDFLRGVNDAVGVDEFPEGQHGGGELSLIVDQGNNGLGDRPGICPDCLVLPVRVGWGLVYDYHLLEAGARYASSMGAKIINFAGVNITWSRDSHKIFQDAYQSGTLTIAASGDEMSFDHWMPAAGEDVLSIKTIFPMVPVELAGIFNLGSFGFTETYCTNYGSHAFLSVPAVTACTSDSTGNTSGMAALLMSYAHERGIDLSADETKQLLTMTAYDIEDHCASIVNLLGVCQDGFDEHFGYGRPDLEAAMLTVGDPDLGIDSAIPPSVRIAYPEWWQTFDPLATPDLQVTGQISSRVAPFNWQVQVAPGNQPLEEDFQTVDSGTSSVPLDGPLATIPIGELFPESWASGTPQNQYSFEVTVRVQASYEGSALGEARKTISVHIDDDPRTGLVPGFPIDIGASGESSPLLYDLDGADDQRLEILFGTGAGQVVALKYNESSGLWENFPGFPLDLAGDGPWIKDSIFGSLAVGDLFGDGTPEIVAATMQGKVYAIDPAGAVQGDPFLPGFPVSADPRDNSSALAFAYGNSFYAAPVLVDLNRDGRLEIVAASADQQAYAWTVSSDKSKSVERLPGWPVLCRSSADLVPADKVCDGSGIPSSILSSPAAGILDPSSNDEDISQYPAVVVGTAEACNEGLMPSTRVYAIYHDGMNHDGGPFLPGWPAKPPSPLGDAIPLSIAVGASSSPAVAITEEGTRIAVGSFGWLPQLIKYRNGNTQVENVLILVALNCIGSAGFSSLAMDGVLQYVLPITGIVRIDELGFQLLNSRIYAMDLNSPHDKIMEGEVESFPLLTSPISADLDNDGAREVIAGSGGHLVHAFALDGKEAADWPKFTHKWTMATPVTGDMDGDSLLEVVVHSREGYLYAWRTEGDNCRDGALNSDWRRHHHDEANTGFYDADTLPPSRIADLAAQQDEGDQVVLTFTATGNDWTCGTAASYDIRYSTSESADLSDPAQFAAASPVSDPPPPFAGGTHEAFIITAPQAVQMAIQVRDAAGNISRISNDAAVEPPADDDTTPDDDATPDDDDSTPSDDDTSPDDDTTPGDDDAADDDNDDHSPVDDDQSDDDDDDNGCGC